MYPTSDGKPVTDLQQADVEILEDGILQKIAQFEQVTVGTSRPQTTAREPSTMNEMRARRAGSAGPRHRPVPRSAVRRALKEPSGYGRP